MEEYWRARSSALPVSSASTRQQGPAWDCASSSRPPWTEGRSAHGRALTTNGKSSDSKWALHEKTMVEHEEPGGGSACWAVDCFRICALQRSNGAGAAGCAPWSGGQAAAGHRGGKTGATAYCGAGDGSHREPLRHRGAVEAGRFRRQGDVDDPRHHVDRLLVHRRGQADRAGARPEGCEGGRREVLEGQDGKGRHRRPARGQRVSLRGRESRVRGGASRQHARPAARPEQLGLDDRATGDGRGGQPPAEGPGVSCHGGLDRAVRRIVRHRVGDLPCAHGDRHCRAGIDRQGGGPGGRGADHDGARPGGRGPRGTRLQLAGAPQQGGHGAGAALRRRRAHDPARSGRAQGKLTVSMNLGNVEGDEEFVSDINTTPLVDVMLVLLIIFLITIPVVIRSIPVQLPKERNLPTQTRPENIVIAVDKDGGVFWNNQPVDDRKLLAQLKEIAVKIPQPEVHIRGDKDGRYEFVGRVVYACQRAGILKIGFITEPPARAARREG